MKKILLLFCIFTLLFISCTGEPPSPVEKVETTFTFTFPDEVTAGSVIIDGEEREMASTFILLKSEGEEVTFIFLDENGKVLALLETEGYTHGGENSYALDPKDFRITGFDAYTVSGNAKAHWDALPTATAYVFRNGDEETRTEETSISFTANVGEEITVSPLFGSYEGQEEKITVAEGRNDIEISVKPLPDGVDITISEDDITLEYGGCISFSTTLPDDTYTTTWYLNGTMLGRGEKIEIFWNEEALNLSDKEEALMLVLEKDGNIYSKTITFVC